MKIRNAKLMAALAGAILGLSLSTVANAGVQDKMDQIFNDMSNVTKPGVFNTQRRGIISGGSAIVRSPIVDTSLINISLPHASGGCGGMDMFAGSISFINADQFIALLRAIAANAKGYAFQIAMNAASSLISEKLGDFQKLIQNINNLNFNSCELAQGIVNTGLNAIGQSEVVKKYGVESNLSGFGDIAESFFHSGSSSNVAKEVSSSAKNNSDLAKKIASLKGNIIWNALKLSNASAQLGKGSEKVEYGTLMAITGTYVTEEPIDNESAKSEADIPVTPYEPLIDPEQLIEGGNLKIYSCDDDDCMKMTQTTVNTTGLKQKFLTSLVGNRSTTGVIAKYHMEGDSAKFSEDEKVANLVMTSGAGMVLRRFATKAPSFAYENAEDIATAMAGIFAFQLAEEYLATAQRVLSSSKMAKRDEMAKRLQERQLSLSNKFTAWAQNHPTTKEIVATYNQAIKNVAAVTAVPDNVFQVKK